MTHDFIYGIRMTPTLAVDIQNAQLKGVASAEKGVAYVLSDLLANEVIIGRTLPDPYQPLMIALSFMEKIDDRTYFNVYQIPNGKLTIVPQVYMDVSDTQFNDVTNETCVARSVLGALMNSVSNEDRVNVNHDNAFSLIDSTLVFGFQLDTISKEKTGDRQAFEVFGFGVALGRASVQEVMDDSDVYDELSASLLAFIKAMEV